MADCRPDPDVLAESIRRAISKRAIAWQSPETIDDTEEWYATPREMAQAILEELDLTMTPAIGTMDEAVKAK